MSRLKDQSVWITGASKGIGRSLALELARRGAVTVLTARGEDELNDVLAEVESIGGRAIARPGDVTDRERMHEIAKEIDRNLHGPDILIANAGSHLFTQPEQFDASEYLALMQLNYGGMLYCIEAVVSRMLERKTGMIVGVASLAGFRGMPRAAAYSASKGAMINFLQSIRFHFQRHGIHVTIVNPGFVRTPLTDKNDFDMPFLTEPETAARIICDGIERRKKEIAFPFPFSTAIRVMRILPYPLYEWIMNRVWSRMKTQ